MTGLYQQQYTQSTHQPETFCKKKAADIAWFVEPEQMLSVDADGLSTWFSDGELNTSYLALDHHVANGRGEQTAIIYDSPVTGSVSRISYAQLLYRVEKFAGGLAALGVSKGDTVVIYMPMVIEAAVAMLACARIGAIHSVVFGGFAPNELAVRIDDAKPKAVICASCGIEVTQVIPYKPLVDEAILLSSHKPEHTVVFQRDQCQAELKGRNEYDFIELECQASPIAPVTLKSSDPLYILYTSGTTGKPKGVVRDNGGHAVALRYSMQAVYDVGPGDVFWAASDVGWVVGHSYIVYAPLITGCTTVMFEGKPVGTPNASTFWRVCAEHKVKAMFTAPTAFRAVRKQDPNASLMAGFDLSSLERIYLAGERLDPSTYHWLKQITGLPVIDHWWQTETGWAIAANPVGIEMQQTKPGSATLAVPGFNVQILDENGQQCRANEQGYIAIKQPLPPGCLATIWQDKQRFIDSYLSQFEGYYASGDGGYIDDDGYLFVMGRTDDVINVAGHRLSTGEMEEVIATHPAVAECAVIGVKCNLKGQLPLGMLVLKDGVDESDIAVESEVKQMVRDEIGAVACFKQAMCVEKLPKTRSGKILRKVLRKMHDNEAYTVPSTIDDPSVLDDINEQFDKR